MVEGLFTKYGCTQIFPGADGRLFIEAEYALVVAAKFQEAQNLIHPAEEGLERAKELFQERVRVTKPAEEGLEKAARKAYAAKWSRRMRSSKPF